MIETSKERTGSLRGVVQASQALLRIFNIAKLLSIVLLIVYLPALVVIALVLVLTSEGPPLINRVYRRPCGRTVDLWEFRTECWKQWQPTPFGAYLRRTNMHRLPALINVFRGDIGMGERVQSASHW